MAAINLALSVSIACGCRINVIFVSKIIFLGEGINFQSNILNFKMSDKIQYGGYQYCIIGFNSFLMSQKHVIGVKNNVFAANESISCIKLKITLQDGRQNP